MCFGFRRSRLTSRVLVLSINLLVGFAFNQSAVTSGNVVLQWNDAIVESIRNTKSPPPVAARAFSITHTAMFDAWAAYDSVAVGTQLAGTLRRPEAERTAINKEKAISFAAYRVLVDLFPTQRAVADAVMSSLE